MADPRHVRTGEAALVARIGPGQHRRDRPLDRFPGAIAGVRHSARGEESESGEENEAHDINSGTGDACR